MSATHGLEILAPVPEHYADVISDAALDFVSDLERQFGVTRKALLRRRGERQAKFDAGELPRFLTETEAVRAGHWTVAPPPPDLRDRRVEITGPVERKMMINALNSGARVFMADFEDSNSPTWQNCIEGQRNLTDAIDRTISFRSVDGREYRLQEKVATLMVRPRGWHLEERHVALDGEPISASLFDFGLHVFHNAKRLLERGSGPYFYLPKLESHLEARLWNEVFDHAEHTLDLAPGSIRATVLIESVLAAFEMDEILYELRTHSVGLNAGRWDYIFSIIKKFRNRPDMILPDRAQVTMTVPFMRAYTELLVKTCHRRGAHAMGGMAAFIPSRRDPEVNETALARVREDKEREAGDGFDGTWVAHPDLVPVAMAAFDRVLGDRPNQVDRRRDEVHTTAEALITTGIPGARVSVAGLRNNISVAVQYLEAWLRGNGAVAIFNLMEDAATAEISRSQVWQWTRNHVLLEDGRVITPELVKALADEEIDKIRELQGDAFDEARFARARTLFEAVALAADFDEFLTLPAYRLLT